MRVEKDHILCHGVLNEELLEIPQPKVGDFGHFCPSCNKDVAGFEVPVHHWTSHVVQTRDTLHIDQLKREIHINESSKGGEIYSHLLAVTQY